MAEDVQRYFIIKINQFFFIVISFDNIINIPNLNRIMKNPVCKAMFVPTRLIAV